MLPGGLDHILKSAPEVLTRSSPVSVRLYQLFHQNVEDSAIEIDAKEDAALQDTLGNPKSPPEAEAVRDGGAIAPV